MIKISLILLTVVSLSYAKTAYELGKTIYMEKACYSCHGIKAEGMHSYPRLANRAKGFLTYKLKRFRSKQSDNQQEEMMITYALKLSDSDIDNLTSYLTDFTEEESSERYDDSYNNWGDGGS
ncbi:MAG: c-type cytochrome [Campylobacterota bacterium]|nr:c-type cytochrome [Campylobacterota bacterium]